MFSGQDAWRKHHLITGCARNPLPGLGTALVIFAGYCVAEAGYTYVTGMPILLFKFDIIFEDFSISDTTLDVHFLIPSLHGSSSKKCSKGHNEFSRCW
jgi:hypothetical protein